MNILKQLTKQCNKKKQQRSIWQFAWQHKRRIFVGALLAMLLFFLAVAFLLMYELGFSLSPANIPIIYENVIRFSRAASVVAVIAVDYARTLHKVNTIRRRKVRENVDLRESDEYQRIAENGESGRNSSREQRIDGVMSMVHLRSAQRLLSLFLLNGGVYVKAGQIMASLGHILPEEYTNTMLPCLDKANWRPYPEVKRLVEEEFRTSGQLDENSTLEDIYTDFSEEPIAAASLAQVHKARLRSTGEEVAVKVQYPGLQNRVDGDVFTISLLTRCVEYLFPQFQFGWLMVQFKENLPNELNFEVEVHNCEEARRLLAHRKDATTPFIYRNLTTNKVITMEFIEGVHINNIEKLKTITDNFESISNSLTGVLCEQTFLHGKVHCDPHPGNILVRTRPGGKKGDIQIVLLDHGLYKEVPEEMRIKYCHLWKAIITGDFDRIRDFSAEFNVDDPYVFASMLTSRSFTESTNLTQQGRTKTNFKALRKEVHKYLLNVNDILASLPEEIILLLKANDLLRSVQTDLGLPTNYFIDMSLYAQRGINEYRSQHSPGVRTKLLNLRDMITMRTRIYFYSALLWIANTYSQIFGLLSTKSRH